MKSPGLLDMKIRCISAGYSAGRRGVLLRSTGKGEGDLRENHARTACTSTAAPSRIRIMPKIWFIFPKQLFFLFFRRRFTPSDNAPHQKYVPANTYFSFVRRRTILLPHPSSTGLSLTAATNSSVASKLPIGVYSSSTFAS